MAERPVSRESILALISEIGRSVDLIGRDRHIRSRRMRLSKLRSDLSALAEACNSLPSLVDLTDDGRPSAPSPAISQRTFTRAELAQYDGKAGKPAYVAVDDVVYDITNNAAWAAATHFGLSAGNDLTNQFSSCHPGRQVLQGLTVVGSLTDG